MMFTEIQASGLPVPCLFYPVIRELGLDVQQVLTDPGKQAHVLEQTAQRYPVAAVVRMTELWCEGAAFGMPCTFSNRDFPHLGAPLCDEAEELAELPVPEVENEITAPLLEAVRLAAGTLDRPLIVGMTGPYTLGSVLGGSTDFMMNCAGEPEETHAFLENITAFLTAYASAYKEAGANGILIAEPATAMISPAMMEEYSNDYLSKIIHAVQDDRFAVIYHNCGAVNAHLDVIGELDAAAFHFGSDVDLQRADRKIPGGRPIMGNLDPRRFLGGGDPDADPAALFAAYGTLSRWIASTGCDLSPGVEAQTAHAFIEHMMRH